MTITLTFERNNDIYAQINFYTYFYFYFISLYILPLPHRLFYFYIIYKCLSNIFLSKYRELLIYCVKKHFPSFIRKRRRTCPSSFGKTLAFVLTYHITLHVLVLPSVELCVARTAYNFLILKIATCSHPI